MAEPSDYTKIMLDKFVERYDEGVVRQGCRAMCWYELPPGVKTALREAFLATAEQMQEELY